MWKVVVRRWEAWHVNTTSAGAGVEEYRDHVQPQRHRGKIDAGAFGEVRAEEQGVEKPMGGAADDNRGGGWNREVCAEVDVQRSSSAAQRLTSGSPWWREMRGRGP